MEIIQLNDNTNVIVPDLQIKSVRKLKWVVRPAGTKYQQQNVVSSFSVSMDTIEFVLVQCIVYS